MKNLDNKVAVSPSTATICSTARQKRAKVAKIWDMHRYTIGYNFRNGMPKNLFHLRLEFDDGHTEWVEETFETKEAAREFGKTLARRVSMERL